MTTSTEGSPGGLRTFLERDHARVAGMCELVLEAFGRDDASAVRRAWDEFETDLREHMAVEEQHLLPLFGQVQPVEAAELRAQHSMLREGMNKLALHLPRHDEVLVFSEDLLAHVRREERLFYHWAERGLSRATQEAVVREITANAPGRAGR